MYPQAVQDEHEVTGNSHPLFADLTGRPLPALSLASTTGSRIEFLDLHRAILYFYPGAPWAPEGGYDSCALDEAQHRAFAHHWHDLLALGCNAFGVSTQSAGEQRTIADTLGIGQPLLCDTDGKLARALGLPSFGADDAIWYCRLTLIVDEGAIARAFYPVTSAVQSPAQAIAWIRRQRWV
jgi:peroxiredoxin